MRIGSMLLMALLLLPVSALADAGTRQPDMLPYGPASSGGQSPLTISSMRAADALSSLMASRISRESPVLVTSMVALDNLGVTSQLGRLTMQQIGSRLSQYGYRVIDSRLARDMVMRQGEGEFMLTRDTARLLQTQYSAQAVLVGSYAVTSGTVYVSLRLVRLDDAAVVAAYEYDLPYRGEVKAMLKKERQAQTEGVWAYYVRRPQAFEDGQMVVPPVKVPAGVGDNDRQQEADRPGEFRSFPVLGPPQRVF